MAVLIYPSLQQPVLADQPLDQPPYKQWADPDLGVNVRKQALAACIASGPQLDPFPRGTPEFIGPDKWWQPFSERLYPKNGLQAARQQFLAYSESAQFPEVVYIDKYLYPFSLPVWHKARLEVGDQPFYYAEPEPEEQDVMSWFRPLSEPKRFPKRLDTGLNPYFTTGAHALGNAYARAYVIC